MTISKLLKLCRLPVPVPVPFLGNILALNMQLIFPRGVSANFVLLIWVLFGGVLLHSFLANFRVMLIMPVLEEPVDTAQDILDRGLIPLMHAGGGHYVEFLKESPIPAYQQLADIAVIPKDGNELQRMFDFEVLIAGTHVYLGAGIDLGSRHVSKERLEGKSPWACWVVNKKWPLNDVLAVHLLRFQQVCTVILLLWMVL